MKLHLWLKKRYLFYRKWHEKSYANKVHFAILLAVVIFNLILLYELQLTIRMT
jgi:hypothetical protein